MTVSGIRGRAAVLSALGIVVLGSCGGSDDSSSLQLTPATSQPADDAGTPAEASPGDNGAVVTIDGNSYQFSPEEVRICTIDEKGIFRATIANADYTKNVDMSLPPEGFVTDDVLSVADNYASVHVTLSDTENWSADAYDSDPASVNNRNIPAGQTQVGSYQFDSVGASGTATFLNLEDANDLDGNYTGQPVSGSFQVSCG